MFYALRSSFLRSTIYQNLLSTCHPRRSSTPHRFEACHRRYAGPKSTVLGHDHALGCVTAGREASPGFCCATTDAHEVRVRGEHVLAPLRHSKEPTGS